jgi:class 3 adenylate cyclase/tetratricopeptide (TPR) repeat protein
MNPSKERWRRVTELLDSALSKSGSEREVFFRDLCADDAELGEEVASLLRAHEGRGALDELASLMPRLERGARPTAIQGERLGPYRLMEEIGHGGMGVVFRARDTRLDRIVALKLLSSRRTASEEARTRFLTEARAAARVDHPNLCTVHDVGESDDGRLYIAMAHCEGETLKERIARGPLPLEEAVEHAVGIARGLAATHDAGILHRDLKPGNVMIAEGRGPRILDFGLARMPGVELTRPGGRMGTMAYMSPEQTYGAEVDARTDIWSLGVVLHEMLTGERPFRGERDEALVHGIRHEDPVGHLPSSLAPVVRRALAKDPDHRYPNARELVRDLQTRADGSGSAGRGGVEVLAEGERRQATLLVARVRGFAELVERLGPNEAERRRQRMREVSAEVVEAHGGTVDRCGGDTMVAVFGVPVMHEDDPLRAIRAARSLDQRFRSGGGSGSSPLQLRWGLDTGLVVAHRGDRSGTSPQIEGAVVRSAGQLADRAASGEILLGPATRRLLPPLVETEAGEPLEVEGHDGPATPHRVIGVGGPRSRLEAAEGEALTRHVGREDELALLDRCLAAARKGDGRLVTVEGEAGLGKSRLLFEFRRGLDPDEVQILQGRCMPRASSTPYLPFVEAVRRLLGLADEAGPKDVVEHVHAIAPELDAFVPFYLHLLSIPGERHPIPAHLEGEDFRLAMTEALAALLTLGSTAAPAVLLLEDWHWADDASQEVLAQIGEMISAHALLVVATYRPGRSLEWGRPSAHSAIHLEPLDPRSAVRMLASVAGTRTFPEELGRVLHERTDGNPFFLEEICRALIEEGSIRVDSAEAVHAGPVHELRLPATVQSVIRARMDRLPPPTRTVLGAASVVGREFGMSVLRAALVGDGGEPSPDPGEALETLRSLGLVQQIGVVPEPTCRFRHVLARDVAYESLLEHRRRTLHGRIGRALEDGDLARSDTLARHFSRAGDWARAVHHGRDAARRASSFSRFPEALDLLEQTQQWLLRLPENKDRRQAEIEILFRRERLCEVLGRRRQQQKLIDKLFSRLDTVEDRAELAELHLRQGDLYTLLRRFGLAERSLETALHISRNRSDDEARRNALRSLGLLRWHQGRHTQALEQVEAALAIDRDRGDIEAVVGDLSNLGNVLKSMGDHERARRHLEEALELSERLPVKGPEGSGELPVKQAYILHVLATVHRCLGDVEGAIDYLERAIEQGDRRRLRVQQSYHLTSLAHVHLREGRIEKSLELYREAVELSRKTRHAVGLSQSLKIYGEVLESLDRNGEAVPHLAEAAERFADLEDVQGEATVRARLARAREKLGAGRDALAAWDRARSLARELGDLRAEQEALEGLARVSREYLRAPALALTHLHEALQRARERGDQKGQTRILNTLGILAWKRGAWVEAREHYLEALALVREMGDRVHEGLILNSLGVTLKAMGRSERAADRLREGIDVNRKTGRARLEGHGLAALADLRARNDHIVEAIDLYERSLTRRRLAGDLAGEGWMLLRLAGLRKERGELGRARKELTRAREIARETDAGDLLEACRDANDW